MGGEKCPTAGGSVEQVILVGKSRQHHHYRLAPCFFYWLAAADENAHQFWQSPTHRPSHFFIGTLSIRLSLANEIAVAIVPMAMESSKEALLTPFFF